MLTDPQRKRLNRGAVVVGLAALAFTGFVFYAWMNVANPPNERALGAMEPTAKYTVQKEAFGWTFRPTEGRPMGGIAFYGGARIDPRAYAPLARELAADGNLVALMQPKSNMPILEPDVMDKAIRAHPEITEWLLIGHSMGGTAAAMYAEKNPGKLAALIFLAGYPATTTRLEKADLPVLMIAGSRDPLSRPERMQQARKNLPPSAQLMVVNGGNHAQFGSYTGQTRDFRPLITEEAQQKETLKLIRQFLKGVKPLPSP
jgi:predicted alpha/beta-hydrolase family hydrolase